MDRGFIPPESYDPDRRPAQEEFLGEFGEREHGPVQVDSTDPRIEVEPESGDIRPM